MSSRVVVIHQTRVERVCDEARQLAGVYNLIASKAEEVLDKGGQLQIQPQMAFTTGALCRMLKDWGVLEQLQAEGVAQKRSIK